MGLTRTTTTRKHRRTRTTNCAYGMGCRPPAAAPGVTLTGVPSSHCGSPHLTSQVYFYWPQSRHNPPCLAVSALPSHRTGLEPSHLLRRAEPRSQWSVQTVGGSASRSQP